MAKEVRKSLFDLSISVIVVYPIDADYETVYKPIFNKVGYGCFIPQIPAILIDGGVFGYDDIDERLWVEAHEIGHYHLGHTSETRNPDEEIFADLYAYKLLKGSAAADLIIEKFPERHGVSFSEKMFNDFLEMIFK